MTNEDIDNFYNRDSNYVLNEILEITINNLKEIEENLKSIFNNRNIKFYIQPHRDEVNDRSLTFRLDLGYNKLFCIRFYLVTTPESPITFKDIKLNMRIYTGYPSFNPSSISEAINRQQYIPEKIIENDFIILPNKDNSQVSSIEICDIILKQLERIL